MIPKRAFFCWDKDRMPWVRTLSVESFAMLNPEWSVDVLRCDGIKGSDILRYDELARVGGFYFDTDIIFVRPMRSLVESVGSCDTGVCYELSGPMTVIDQNGGVKRTNGEPSWFSIASLFSAPQNEFFASACLHAMRPEVVGRRNMQSCGVLALLERFGTIENARSEFAKHEFFNIPRRAFLPVPAAEARVLFRADEGLYDDIVRDESVYGIHWSGGDQVGRIADGWTAADYWRESTIGKAIEGVELERARRLDSPTYEGHGMSC